MVSFLSLIHIYVYKRQELSEVKRDIEDYFVELMEGGARAKAGAARLGEEGMPAETPAVSNGKGGAHHA